MRIREEKPDSKKHARLWEGLLDVGECGGLGKNGLYRLVRSATVRRHGLVEIGGALWEEVGHWRWSWGFRSPSQA